MNYRRRDTQRAHTGTCGWIARHPCYTAWLEEGSGILWVKGKPGSGKSTLMEFLLRDFEQQAVYKESLPLSFFLHGRGTPLQKSRLGMFRSLLHQLLQKSYVTLAQFRHEFEERSRGQGEPGKDWNWHVNEVREFFISAIEKVARTQPVNIFVDALDEANDGTDDQNASRQIVADFHELNDLLHRRKLRSTICFSCCHFPIVATNRGQEIYVEDENHTDILAYVKDKLHAELLINETENNYLTELQETIVKGAQGVFQWAALVVAMTVRYHNHGKSRAEIRKMLAKVPRELGDVYKHILSEVIDEDDYPHTLRLMRWVCLAERPLTVKEASFAMSLPDTELCPSESPPVQLELPAHDSMLRQVISLSGGLIESKQHKNEQILQFIHQSVKDFLLKDGLGFLDLASNNPIGRGHHQLSVICANYVTMAGINNSNSLDIESVKAWLPFMDYAAQSWFLHAENAETQGVSQCYLLRYSQQCPKLLEQWVKFYSVLGRHDSSGRRPANDSNLLHIASSANLLSVVQSLLSKSPHLEQSDGFGNRPLHHASR
jgi:hypothetical protein